MNTSRDVELSVFTDELAGRVRALVQVAAAQAEVKAAVEANHDDNRWWPLFVRDWRIRMAVAGWSSRVSYAMVDTYAAVVRATDACGWDRLADMDDDDITGTIRPLGLTAGRVRYLRSLQDFLASWDESDQPLTTPAGAFIESFAQNVTGASYKVAQCATLYSRGYHCGVIPVDSGMVTRLAPLLGVTLENRPEAHERLRSLLQACAATDADDYRDLIREHRYAVTIPDDTVPTWWLHLVLIYFKRLYLNRPVSARLCARRPVCPRLLDCEHTGWPR